MGRLLSQHWRLQIDVHPFRGVLVVLVVAALALVGVIGYRTFAARSTESVTSLRLDRLDRPGSARLADWHGMSLVVNLFASWCPSCLSEMPAFERTSHDYAGRVVIVGVDS